MNVVKKEIDLEAIEERFKRYLYRKNGKLTSERIHLLRALYEHDGHFSVDEIIDLCRQEKYRVSRSTVYRTMDLLVRSGLVNKLAFEGQDTRYESALNSSHHDHIICMDCHKIIEFYDDKLEKIQDEILAAHHLEPVKHVHELYGSCKRNDCPEKSAIQV